MDLGTRRMPYGFPYVFRVLTGYPSDPPYTLEAEFNGDISVCDAEVNVLATFKKEFRDFAEDMCDRLIIRHLVSQTAEQPRCPECKGLAMAVRIPKGGDVAVYTHEDGAEHQVKLGTP